MWLSFIHESADSLSALNGQAVRAPIVIHRGMSRSWENAAQILIGHMGGFSMKRNLRPPVIVSRFWELANGE